MSPAGGGLKGLCQLHRDLRWTLALMSENGDVVYYKTAYSASDKSGDPHFSPQQGSIPPSTAFNQATTPPSHPVAANPKAYASGFVLSASQAHSCRSVKTPEMLFKAISPPPPL